MAKDMSGEKRTSLRRAKVLEAIVRDYVSTHEPVASRSLVERHNLRVSPATIRNDMAALEDAGFITQPHTSAGRVPTDAGYRSFVDSLDDIKPLSQAERRAIERLLDGAVDLDDAIAKAVRLLAQLTHHVAVVQYPSLHRSSVRHIELVSLAPTHVMLILITDGGRVEQRVVSFAEPVSEDELNRISKDINAQCSGKYRHDIEVCCANLASVLPVDRASVVARISGVISEVLSAEVEERVALAGTANLSRNATDFTRSIAPVLDVLEEQVILLKLMTRMHDGVSVSIGQENYHEGLGEASLVATSYEVDGSSVARLGVVGPTRMDYPGTIAAVYAISQYLSDILTGK